jgi:hypothetical protein
MRLCYLTKIEKKIEIDKKLQTSIYKAYNIKRALK